MKIHPFWKAVIGFIVFLIAVGLMVGIGDEEMEARIQANKERIARTVESSGVDIGDRKGKCINGWLAVKTGVHQSLYVYDEEGKMVRCVK